MFLNEITDAKWSVCICELYYELSKLIYFSIFLVNSFDFHCAFLRRDSVYFYPPFSQKLSKLLRTDRGNHDTLRKPELKINSYKVTLKNSRLQFRQHEQQWKKIKAVIYLEKINYMAHF